jgi:hypothetical protein
MTKPDRCAHIVAVMMGMGHVRAAYPLRDISIDGILLYGSMDNTPKIEYRVWRKIRASYYWFSRACEIPFIGKYFLRILDRIQYIGPYYPRKDRSRPNYAVKYLESQIKHRGLCRALIEKIGQDRGPAVHTYFATAIAADKANACERKNYLMICDSDFNRVWVPKNPRQSAIKYLAPCKQVKRRLLSYGIQEGNIFLTGFPLPKENIGSEKDLEILKNDVSDRLFRLDPSGAFFHTQGGCVKQWLGRSEATGSRCNGFTVMFAIGGAGAQANMALAIIKSLGKAIREGKVRLILSVGIQKRVFDRVEKQVIRLGLQSSLTKGLEIIFDRDPLKFLDKFNLCLRQTDVLWTKPSELVFYTGLGIPIVMAPPIGTHEECNARWLQEIHAGLAMPGRAESCDEWLFDLRESGVLAQAAWDGFLKVRKLGAFKIERLIRHETFDDGRSPLER